MTLFSLNTPQRERSRFVRRLTFISTPLRALFRTPWYDAPKVNDRMAKDIGLTQHQQAWRNLRLPSEDPFIHPRL